MPVQNVLRNCLIVGAGALLLASPDLADAQQRAIPTREVAPPGDEPYATQFTINVPSGNGVVASSPDPVPAGKRLVIEFVSVTVIIDSAETPYFALNDAINGVSHAYLLPLSPGVNANYQTTRLVKLYHDGNGASGPSAQCARLQNSFSPMSCNIVISGYLIDQ
jgi:hypothetical protein